MLVLTGAQREPDNHLLWEGLSAFAETDVVYLGKDEQKRLDTVLSRFDLSRYDRVILDLLFRHLVSQVRVLARIPGLLLYEEDACQEFIRSSKWFGRFSAFYHKLPGVRVIITGYRVCEQFKALGVDACFLPKGYDSSRLYDMGRERDIELGFIGRLSSDAYKARREFLERAAREYGLQIMRTAPGDEYREGLNCIRIFVSADIGLGEYMAKNFEAMACGCVLMAYRQGGGEEQALGLVDGENVLLYSDLAELRTHVSALRADQQRAQRIADAGRAFVETHLCYAHLATRMAALLAEPWPVVPPLRGWRAVWQRLSFF